VLTSAAGSVLIECVQDIANTSACTQNGGLCTCDMSMERASDCEGVAAASSTTAATATAVRASTAATGLATPSSVAPVTSVGAKSVSTTISASRVATSVFAASARASTVTPAIAASKFSQSSRSSDLISIVIGVVVVGLVSLAVVVVVVCRCSRQHRNDAHITGTMSVPSADSASAGSETVYSRAAFHSTSEYEVAEVNINVNAAAHASIQQPGTTGTIVYTPLP
jgi:hypothetical protein